MEISESYEGPGAPPPNQNRYIVQTSDSASASRLLYGRVAASHEVTHVYSEVFTGFAARMSAETAEELRRNPRVRAVTPDARTRASGTTQIDPPWGLDRIDQRPTAGNARYSYDTDGTGVTVFVMDTGIRITHTEFRGRAVSGYDFVDRDPDASDCYGHGTHVAGTIGGATYGVAKNVHLVSLRVWDCFGSGWMSDMIAALDWALTHKTPGRAVVNISGGGESYAPMDEAVQRAVAAGIPVVVAANNASTDACSFSPAGAPDAITVAATDSADTRWPFSNYGRCVDLFAPGVHIESSANASDTASAFRSGTSMATPHVAGVVARYLQRQPLATPAQVTAAIVRDATRHAVIDPVGSPNRLLYAAARAPQPPLPDLVMTDLRWAPTRPEPGSKVLFTVRVTNEGTAPSRGGVGYVAIMVDGKSVASSDIETRSLAPGASIELTAPASGRRGGW
ncbi:MAG: S8 family serine peptidase, partial [Actinomycetota bacterium]|nr:S8 family serine peptidase [Actinomycetota bacterium]